MSHDHRCRRDAMCSQWERVDNVKMGAQIEAEIGLCDPCRWQLETVLGNLCGDYADLGEALGDLGSGAGEHVRHTKEPPINLRVSVEALQAEMLHVVWTWHEVVARVMGIDGKTRYELEHSRPAAVVEGATRLLARSVSVLLAARDELVAVWEPEQVSLETGWVRKGRWEYESQHGVDGAIQMMDLHHRTRRALGLTKARQRHRLPCPRCEGQLTSEYGGNLIECGLCSFQRTRDDYEKLCLVLAERRGA